MDDDTGSALIPRALWLLERKQRTTHEIREYFRTKGHDPEEIDGVVARLTRMGLLDDRVYVERYISGPAVRKGYGRARVYRELVAKGVDSDLVHSLLEEADDPDREYRLLSAAGRRKWAELNHTNLPPEKIRSRLSAHLQRRGFSTGSIIRFLGEIAGADEMGHPGEDDPV